MVRIRIERAYLDKQTESYLVVETPTPSGYQKVFECKALELPWINNQRNISCIPEGSYSAIRHSSPKYGDCVWIQDVPNRSEILIHAGNYSASKNPKTGKPDSLGCILVGSEFRDIDMDGHSEVIESVRTMHRLMEVVTDKMEVLIREAKY